MNSHVMNWTNLKINVLIELAMKFQDREHQMLLSTTPMAGKTSRRPIHSSSNTKMFYSHISSKTIKSEMCKAINSFSLQVGVAGVSVEISFSMTKKPAMKRLFGTKSKRSSKKGKVGIQESSSETHMEIEFENDDYSDNMSDGYAESLHCTGFFSRMTSKAKNGLNV